MPGRILHGHAYANFVLMVANPHPSDDQQIWPMIGSVDEAVMGAIAVQNFLPILLLTNGRPGRATLVPGLDMYQSAFSNDQYGHGMAMGTLLFVVMLVFTPVAMRLLRSRTASNPTQ
jgi:hypothetical protein